MFESKEFQRAGRGSSGFDWLPEYGERIFGPRNRDKFIQGLGLFIISVPQPKFRCIFKVLSLSGPIVPFQPVFLYYIDIPCTQLSGALSYLVYPVIR